MVATGTGPIDGSNLIGIGVDAVEVARLRQLLARRPSMAGRLFTEDELAYCTRATDPIPRLATRFAAKEATMKALGVGLGAFKFSEVEVVRIGLGPPTLRLHQAAAALAARSGVSGWHLSLTHTDDMAMAFVVAEGVGAASSSAPVGAAS
ncbi:MAG TPA: holo-ACP synthase [Acidimicrobiales bacterium]|nr:holo-ACP synthase [Acidimicrobiales bacterium]